MKPKNTLVGIVVVLAVVVVLALWTSRDTAMAPGPEEYDTEDSVTALSPKPVALTPSTSAATNPKQPAASLPVTVAPRVLENGQYVSVVNFTSKGFEPPAVSVKQGESVRFVNKSGSAMRIRSSAEYTGLSQEKSVGQGGVYELSFTKSGTWSFYNGTNKGVIGVVSVQ